MLHTYMFISITYKQTCYFVLNRSNGVISLSMYFGTSQGPNRVKGGCKSGFRFPHTHITDPAGLLLKPRNRIGLLFTRGQRQLKGSLNTEYVLGTRVYLIRRAYKRAQLNDRQSTANRFHNP